ncbi:MAG: hypothetical protein N2484_06860 [Clostridia bacterium]|nr:hypothetical protein [Clostridia bacterium]
MDYSALLRFLANNLVFSFTVIIISFVLGWILYNNVISSKISLREALFEKDNLAAWIEFIGAFIFPTLYLAAKSIEGSLSETWYMDLLICITYVLSYVAAFTLLRMLSGLTVRLIGAGDSEGKVNLNSEIYVQKNIAAALFSVALSTVFVNCIKFLDVLPGYFVTSLYKVSIIFIFSLLAFIVYSMVVRQKTTLFKELFIDNNAAAGVCFAGFMFAVEVILSGVVTLQVEFVLSQLVAVSLISLLLFGILSIIFKAIFKAMIKVDIWNEIYEQNNIGAAIGQVALYIGIANVIVHFLK